MDPLEQALRECLRFRIGTGDSVDLQQALTGVDPHGLAVRALEEGLAGIVYSAVVHTGAVDRGVLEWLHTEHVRVAAVTLQARRDGATAFAALSDAGVETRLLKGVALTFDSYRSPGLRPMTDLDMLVRRTDVKTAVAALGQAGYAVTSVAWEGPGLLLEINHEVGLRPRMGALRLPIDLHWHLFHPADFRDADFERWTWSAPRELGESECLGLRPEAAVLNLAGHAHLQRRRVLRRRHDLAEFLVRVGDEVDWNQVFAWARRTRLEIALRRALIALRHHWRLKLPAAAIRRLEALEPRRDSLPAGGTGRFRTRLQNLRTARRWSTRLAMVRYYAVPTREHMQIHNRSYLGRWLGWTRS